MARVRRTSDFIEIRGLNYYREFLKLKRMGILLFAAPFIIFAFFAVKWSAPMGAILALGLSCFFLLIWYAKIMGYLFRFHLDREAMEWRRWCGLIRKEVKFKDVQCLKLVRLCETFEYASEKEFPYLNYSVQIETFWIWQLVAVLQDGSEQLIIEEAVPYEMKKLGDEFVKIMNVELVESTVDTI